ncbi:MAG TPA: DUF92 domain-containing protein [Balneolaceae bacterium]|nr:DUF92 domain-containing protein [Balneolaceae bacterium]
MFRIINYCFGFILIFLFILEGMAADHIRILLGLILAGIIACAAFILNRISLDALKAAILAGTFAFGLGGFQVATALVLFFVTSVLLSDLPGKVADPHGERPEDHNKRRTGYQILANSFWMMFFLIFWFVTGVQSFLIAAIAAVAASNSDTWATEIGQRNSGKTKDILTMKEVPPGEDGGVSSKGLAAALAGSFLIGLSILAGSAESPGGMILIAGISGFAGCLSDSILGAWLKNREDRFKIPGDFSGTPLQFLNNLTNWTATGIAGIIALIFTQIFIG